MTQNFDAFQQEFGLFQISTLKRHNEHEERIKNLEEQLKALSSLLTTLTSTFNSLTMELRKESEILKKRLDRIEFFIENLEKTKVKILNNNGQLKSEIKSSLFNWFKK